MDDLNLKSGEIVVFDKAYIKFNFLHDLTERGVFWVGRAKDNFEFKENKERAILINYGTVVNKNERIIPDSVKKSAESLSFFFKKTC